ncbi:cardioexcitatory receptor [Plakobranchus ocellatus]|uniref:Cardioexcitatory receptor n=1 Tax=Plakobranchus ocellatus TaxID=259542 RepID=A0AAV4CGY0_9GAST|nr:cardioexcitatory receptor [Plakobranchus ocellatus]
MSVDRYVAILRPMRPKMSRRAFVIIMTTIWILSFSVPLPTALTSSVTYQNFSRVNTSNSTDTISNINSSSSSGTSGNNSIGSGNSSLGINGSGTYSNDIITAAGWENSSMQMDDTLIIFERGLCFEVFENEQHRYIYSVVIMMLQYFVPLAVITVTNSHIGYIVWIKKTPGEAEADRDRRMAASKRRLVKMIIIVVVIYAVCWLPLHVITVVGDHNPEIYNLPHIDVVWLCAHWLAMSHSCYNPIVYFSLNTTFRRNLKRMMLICRTSIRRYYRNRKRRCRRGDNNNINNMGSASSLQQNGGLGTGGTSGGGDWTISGDIDEDETEFTDPPFNARTCSTRSSRTSYMVKSGPASSSSIRGAVGSAQPGWRCVTSLNRKSRKKDMYV